MGYDVHIVDGGDDYRSVPESPLHPENLLRLFLQPRRFFASNVELDSPHSRNLGVATAAVAVALVLVNTAFFALFVSTATAAKDLLASAASLTPWKFFWPVFGGVAIAAVPFIWWLSTAWYSLRLRWCGETDAEPHAARLVMIHAFLVFSLPAAIYLGVTTLYRRDYLEAWNAPEPWRLVLAGFLIWSVFVSYRGARTVFHLSKGKARFWFFLLPLAAYLLLAVALIGPSGAGLLPAMPMVSELTRS